MKTQILMTIIGLFMALTNISYAGSTNNSLPECCKKQESCCVKDATCCQGNNVVKESSDCCTQQEACCESNSSCFETGKTVNSNYKDQFHSNVSGKKNMSCGYSKSSCCK